MLSIITALFLLLPGASFSAGRSPAGDKKGVASLKGIHQERLANGVTLLVREDHAQPLVSVQVWVKVGSLNETAKTNGLSHFLEHLIFKGTEKYPGDEISRKTETQGGMINAATSKEFTQFYIDTQKAALADTIDILADAMANAAFPNDEIEKERPVVIEEIRRHSDNPGAVLYDLYNEALFLKTPYRSTIIGTEDIIRNVSRQEIIDYYKTFYVPENMFVGIAGDFNTADVVRLAKETFGKQKNVTPPPAPSLIEPEHKAISLSKKKDVEQTYWYGGFLGPVITSKDQFAADVTSTILGGGRSSRLFRRLREEKQLVYSIGASYWSQRGTGALTCSAVFSPEKEQEVIREIINEINELEKNGPTDQEIARAKQMTTSQWHFGIEKYHDQASLMAYWHMQGNPDMVQGYIAGINAVEKKDVQEFLKKYYRPQGLNQALLVPEQQAPETQQ